MCNISNEETNTTEHKFKDKVSAGAICCKRKPGKTLQRHHTLLVPVSIPQCTCTVIVTIPYQTW